MIQILADQNAILKTACILRDEFPGLRMSPKVAAVTLFDGPPQRTRLNILNASPRSVRRTRSLIGKFLASVMFSLKFHGVRSFGLLRVALPNSEFRRSMEMPWLKAVRSYHLSANGSNLSPLIGARQFS